MPLNLQNIIQPSSQTFEGIPDGMNTALPPQEIQDTEARYLQDILLDYPGLIRRRGPVKAATGFPTFATKISGIAHALDPTGASRLAVLHGDDSNGYAGMVSSDFTTYTDFGWNGAFPSAPPTTPYRIVDAKSSLNGGTWIGTSSAYTANGPVQNLAWWQGGNKADYTTGTLSVTRGSTTVTGSGTSWLSNVVPGMFLFTNTDDPYTLAYQGIVVSVPSNTQLILGDVALYTATAKTYKLTSFIGFSPRVVKGRITTTTASTTVTGANTKFSANGLGTGTWQLYRASDLAFIGKVSTVSNDTGLTLAANAAKALNNERYIAFRVDADSSISTQSNTAKVGFLTSTYASRQWYANNGQDFSLTSRVWFSDSSHPMAVDMDNFAGDFINVASTSGVNSPIKQIMAAYNALLVFKEQETFGIFGSDPTTFSVKKIEDDGCLSGMSVQPYGGGVIWAGRQGIHFYNGIQADNITAGKLGDFYKNMLRNLNPTQYRMWSMVAREHYFLHIEQCAPNVPVIKGSVSTTPTNMTIVVNMISRAITIFTNTCIRGAVVMPQDTGFETLYVVNDSTTGYIASSQDLFDTDGVNDSIHCDAAAALGPDFYIESKKYAEGDSMHKKLFKQLAINYLAQGDALKLDTVVGLNDIGFTSIETFPPTVYTWDTLATTFGTWDALAALIPTWDQVILSVFSAKRIKFLKRSQHMAFRLYQASSAVSRVKLGPFQLLYKWQRLGRI